MASKEKTVNVALTFNESGIICNCLMQAINQSGGFDKVPPYILGLFEKLAKANDEARELGRAKWN